MIDFLTRLFFESLPLLLISEIIAIAIVLAVHRQCWTPRTRRAVWITLAICAVLIAVQHAVETDRERLKVLMSSLAASVDAGDMAAIDERLDPDFSYRGRDKEAFLAETRGDLQRFQIDEASVSGFEVLKLQGDRATVRFRAVCDWHRGDQAQYNILSHWEVDCRRRDDGWKLVSIDSAKIGWGTATIDLEQARRY